MSDFKSAINPHTGNLQLVLKIEFRFKGSVDSTAELPLTGNTEGNVYKVKGSSDSLFMWTIAATSGDLSDWKDIGAINSVAWGSITGTLSDQTDLQSELTTAKTWGNIIGTLSDQTDLQTALDAKQVSLTLSPDSAPVTLDSLLELDADDESTTIVDSTGNHSWTIDATNEIDTAQKKFGLSSLRLDASGSLSVPLASDFEIQDGNDFCVAFFFKFNSAPSSTTGIIHFDNGSFSYRIQYNPTDDKWALYYGGGTGTLQWDNVFEIADTNWHHFCLFRHGPDGNNAHNIYIDGTRRLTIGLDVNSSFSSGGTFQIGNAVASASAFDGWIDNVIVEPNYFLTTPAPTITVPTTAVLDSTEGIMSYISDTEFRYNTTTVQQIIDVINAQHTQNTDTILDNGGSNPISSANLVKGAIEFIIGDGSNEISTGVQGFIEIPFPCTITEVRLLAEPSGSIVVDIWKDTYANYPPTNADTITASAVPTISSDTDSEDTSLTGWTTSVSEGDILGYNVDSITTLTRVTVVLKIKRT